MYIMGFILALLIGVVLGLIGGGGAILTVPLVELFFGKTTYEATTYSLVVVTFASLVGILQRVKTKDAFALKEAFIFVIPSLLVAFAIRFFVLPNIPDYFTLSQLEFSRDLVLTFLLIAVMLFIGVRLLLKRQANVDTPASTSKIISFGIITGLLAGFLGAGGGFIIVPILMGMGIPIKKAVGTSMLIVVIQSSIALLGDFLVKSMEEINQIDFQLLAIISLVTMLGVVGGTWLQRVFSGQLLRKFFGILLLLVATGLLIDRFL